MPTTSAVHMVSPTGGNDTGFRVYYDGDVVGDALKRLIERDGYAQVFAVFQAQPSRFWREITPDVGDALPEYVSRFPENIPRCHPVPRYGVLFIGPEELEASRVWQGVDLESDGDRAYRVGATGNVSVVR